MKNKKMIFGIILLLFAITGICNISNVSAVNHTLSPRSYIGFSEYCNTGDTIDYEITSDISVNVYIMNDNQIDLYISGSELEPEYFIKRVLSINYIHRSYLVDLVDDIYWVFITNPSYYDDAHIDVIVYIIPGEPEKSITINSPTTNDVFDNGNNYIRWSTTGTINYVRIELYYDGSFLEVIDSQTNNDGSCAWYLSSSDTYSEGSYYQIKISDYNDNSIYDFSDYFTIEIDEDYNDSSTPAGPGITLLLWLAIILPIIAVIVIVAVLVRRRRKKIPREVIRPEIIPITPIKVYCRECGTEILDKTRKFCSNCGTKIIN